jgi:hypothetical protein
MHLLVARFVNASKPVSVYSDQTVADAFCVLSKEKTGVSVIDRKTWCLTGMIQCSDVYLLLDDNSLFKQQKVTFLFPHRTQESRYLLLTSKKFLFNRTMNAEEFVKLKNKNDKGSTEHSRGSETGSLSILSPQKQSAAKSRPVSN